MNWEYEGQHIQDHVVIGYYFHIIDVECYSVSDENLRVRLQISKQTHLNPMPMLEDNKKYVHVSIYRTDLPYWGPCLTYHLERRGIRKKIEKLIEENRAEITTMDWH